MKKTRVYYEPWLRDYIRKRQPDLEPPLLAAIDAFDTVQEECRLDAILLAPIVDAASSSRVPLYECATSFLGRLTGEYALARQAVEEMALNPRSHVRFNSILCLSAATPHDFTLRLIRQGLRDNSAKVRCKAGDWAVRLRIHDLVQDLAVAFAAERNAKAKKTIEFGLRLLRDGYILRPGPGDDYYITTFCSNGIASRRVARSDVELRGVQAIIAESASK